MREAIAVFFRALGLHMGAVCESARVGASHPLCLPRRPAHTAPVPARLAACSSCARHIRVDEERCPFCGVTCPDAFASSRTPEPPPRGLSRAELSGYARTAARVAATVGSGAAIAIALSCCDHPRSDDNEVAVYGGPPPDAAPRDAGGGG
jgi:hypothetical protein